MADVFAKVSCTNCQEEINGVRVQCCECTDFDICLQCFASGAEIGPHRNDHSYKFVDHCAIVIGGRGSWTGIEELQLLDAVELYGFGNWDLVSQHVKTRTPEEVRDEYISRYLDGNIGKSTWGDLEKRRPVLVDQVPEDKGPLAPAVTAKLPPLDITPEEAVLLGYKPHRDDYEREYDMSAEQIVSSLQLDTSQDSKVEILMKLAMVDMYCRKLRERTRRKRVVRDYQLVSKFFSKDKKDPNKKPLTKEQKELRERMRIFSQFQTAAEHERLIANMERERELRIRLQELLKYRSLGVTSQEDAVHFEQHAAFQNQQLKAKTGNGGYAIFNREAQSKKRKSAKRRNSAGKNCTSPSLSERGRLSCDKWNKSSSCSSENSCDAVPESEAQVEKAQLEMDTFKVSEVKSVMANAKDSVVQFFGGNGWAPYMTST